MIGITITDTITPAMKVEATQLAGAFGSGLWKNGMKPRWWDSQAVVPRMRGMTKYSPNRATMMLGIAAIRSMTAIRVRRSRGGAYSAMNRAVARPTGTAMIRAITAMSTPSGRIAAMPN